MRQLALRAAIVGGVFVAVLGAGLAIFLGPDGKRTTGPHQIDTNAFAIATAPDALRWANVRIHVHAQVNAYKPVFIGVGNAVDVSDYLANSQHTEIIRYRHNWNIETREVEGEPGLPAAPTALDWWIAQSAGIGGANLDMTLPDDTVQLVILSVGSSDLSGLTVEVAYSLPIGFWGSIGLIPMGLGIAIIAWMLHQGRSFWREEDDDELVISTSSGGDIYLWIDEDGVEHELTEEELAELGDVEIVEEVEETEIPPPTEPEEPEETEDPEEVEHEVVYVWVDEDGVEHEMTPEEAAEHGYADEGEEEEER